MTTAHVARTIAAELLAAVLILGQTGCVGRCSSALPHGIYAEFTGCMAKPYTRQLAVIVTYLELQELPNLLPLVGPTMKLVGGGARVFLYDVDANTVVILTAMGLPTSECSKFRCEIAGWADGAVYLRLTTSGTKVGEQIQFRRLGLDGAVADVDALPPQLITRDVSLARGGLVICGGSSTGIQIATSNSSENLVLRLDMATLSPIPVRAQ